MDEQTQQFYSANAAGLAEEYASCADGVDRYFAVAFERGARVLDIGCGCGRDAAILHGAGFEAVGVDPCREFVELARKENRIPGGYACDSLPELATVEDSSFDGVLCSGVLMHLPAEQLFDAAYGIRRVLREGGRLLISIPVDANMDPDTNRDAKGRLFNGVTPDRFQVLFERIGFRKINRWRDSDSLGRPHRSWTTLLFVLESGDGRRGKKDHSSQTLSR